MSVGLYMDQHVPGMITRALRRRGIDVLTPDDEGTRELPDEQLLERATALGRVLFTQDEDFLAIATRWQREGRSFPAVAFAEQINLSIGRAIDDLVLIAEALELGQMESQIYRLPF